MKIKFLKEKLKQKYTRPLKGGSEPSCILKVEENEFSSVFIFGTNNAILRDHMIFA